MCNLYEEIFSQTYTRWHYVIWEEMSEWHLVGMDRHLVPMCKMFVRSVVVLLLVLYHVLSVWDYYLLAAL